MTPKLTKREYFAIEAMKAILSNSKVVTVINLETDAAPIAFSSVILAERLIEELNNS